MKKLFIFILFTGVLAGQVLYLFDNTKDETAGNADWIIDDDMPVPQPANPGSGDDWTGGISDWGFDLLDSGESPYTLPPGVEITYGDTSDPLDLSNFDVFVICEPQDPFSTSEKQAILDFVYNGGGLVLVANHYGSDRNSNGWDSPRVFNDLGAEEYFGMHFNVSGESYNNFSDSPDSNVSGDPDDPLLHGPYGDVAAIGFHSGTAMTLHPEFNSSVRGHVWVSGASHGNTLVMVASATYGAGRVVGVGDSSPADDGNGNPGNVLYDGWTAVGEDNYSLFLNACYWASGGENNIRPFIRRISRSPQFPGSEDTVTVWARISDDSSLVFDSIYFRTDEGDWQSLSHDSARGREYYFHIPPAEEYSTVYYFIKAVDPAGRWSVSDTFHYQVTQGGAYNLDGWVLIQENSHREFYFDNVSILPGSYVIIARNCTRSQFESFWGVQLPDEVVFLNGGNSFPVINGSENYTLVNAVGDTADGPTISMSSGYSIQRVSPLDPASSPSSWDVVPDSLATPGSGANTANSHKIVINEASDASGSGNYIYEFVELFYDLRTDVEEENRGGEHFTAVNVAPSLDKLSWLSPPYSVYDVSGRRLLEVSASGKARDGDLHSGLYIVVKERRVYPVLILR